MQLQTVILAPTEQPHEKCTASIHNSGLRRNDVTITDSSINSIEGFALELIRLVSTIYRIDFLSKQ